MDRAALLIIDIQNDYFPGGRMENVGAEAAGANAGRLLAAFRAASRPVVHIQHESVRPGSTFFLPGTRGMDIHHSVAPAEGEPVVLKHYPNSFRDTNLEALLQQAGVERLVITGMMTCMCVDATTRAAFDMGYGCMVAHDGCAAPDLAFNGTAIPAAQVHGSFLAALGMIYAEVAGTDALIGRFQA